MVSGVGGHGGVVQFDEVQALVGPPPSSSLSAAASGPCRRGCSKPRRALRRRLRLRGCGGEPALPRRPATSRASPAAESNDEAMASASPAFSERGEEKGGLF